MERIRLRFLHIRQIKNRLQTVSGILTDEERLRAGRFVREEDRLLYTGGVYLVRTVFGKEAVIGRSRAGKPFAEGGYFNVSHSVDTVGAAFCETREVGLDIEKIREGFEDVGPFCLSPEEAESGHGFFELFTSKESLVKAEGGGWPDDPVQVPALPLDGKVIYGGKPFFRRRYRKDGFAVSVCLQGEDFLIEEEKAFEN
ncbi:MAG: hypothetical protein ILO68_08320 [Clostridia bacterium]|nr:hypothetical protein [Clostridia bacterium]